MSRRDPSGMMWHPDLQYYDTGPVASCEDCFSDDVWGSLDDWERNTRVGGAFGLNSRQAEELVRGILAGEDITVIYAHLQEGSIVVKNGDYVTPGTVLGRTGCSGSCVDPHLHYEVKVGGVRQNPRDMLLPLPDGAVRSEFGPRDLKGLMGRGADNHGGMDFRAAEGSILRTKLYGTVTTGYQFNQETGRGWGHYVQINVDYWALYFRTPSMWP